MQANEQSIAKQTECANEYTQINMQCQSHIRNILIHKMITISAIDKKVICDYNSSFNQIIMQQILHRILQMLRTKSLWYKSCSADY